VQQHFESIVPVTDFRSNTKSMFSCVDSRGEVNELVSARPAPAAPCPRRRSPTRAALPVPGPRPGRPPHSAALHEVPGLLSPLWHPPPRAPLPQGTPGGDFSELSAAIVVYLNQTNQPVTDNTVFNIFKAFVESNTDAERPFYFHSSDEKLKKIFHSLADDGIKATVFPER
jgi:hypothetical protein